MRTCFRIRHVPYKVPEQICFHSRIIFTKNESFTITKVGRMLVNNVVVMEYRPVVFENKNKASNYR